ITFQPRRQPSIVDLLAVAELSAECDHTREGYSAILFTALKTLFDGCVTGRAKTASWPSEVAAEMKSAVINMFPSRRQHMEEEIDLKSGRSFYVGATQISQLRADNSELEARAAILEERVGHLKVAVSAAAYKSRTAPGCLRQCCGGICFGRRNDQFRLQYRAKLPQIILISFRVFFQLCEVITCKAS
ncbi:hypothetical protein B0H11DRAFT_1994507, partial [Mycena galericulata]